MKLELFQEDKHFAEIKRWWLAHNWPIVGIHTLSNTGYVAVKDDVMIAACWLYLTNGPWAALEWMVGNPGVSYEVRAEAQDKLIEGLSKLAKVADAKLIFTNTNHKRLIERFKNNGYNITDEGMTNLVRIL